MAELASEDTFVEQTNSFFFPEEWEVNKLWVSCFVYVATNEILRQLKNKEREQIQGILMHFDMESIMNLMACVKKIEGIIEDIFGHDFYGHSTENSYLNKKPNLLTVDGRRVDLDAVVDVVAWGNINLWTIHDIAMSVTHFRLHERTNEHLRNAYT